MLGAVPKEFVGFCHFDTRGCFAEVFRVGLSAGFIQKNILYSKKNVLRGLHFSTACNQGKFVQVVSGIILDVAVSIVKSSFDFGKVYYSLLWENNFTGFWIPPGYAHGFLSLTSSLVIYDSTAIFDGCCEKTLHYLDSDIRVDWLIPRELIIVSDKDSRGGSLNESAIY